MRFNRSTILCAAAALISAGCEVHEHDQGPAALQGEVVVNEPQGEVIDGPGVVPIDVEPDPAQRVYVYDEGYPPGTYVYNNYYYYGGYRYPRDVFVNQYVQQNIRARRYTNPDNNRRAGQTIVQSQRAEFARTRGVRQAPAAKPEAPQRVQTPARQPEQVRPDVERPENRSPGVVAPAPANEVHHAAAEQPANRTPAVEPRHAADERTATPAPANQERRSEAPHSENSAHSENNASPAKEPAKSNQDAPRREEGK